LKKVFLRRNQKKGIEGCSEFGKEAKGCAKKRSILREESKKTNRLASPKRSGRRGELREDQEQIGSRYPWRRQRRTVSTERKRVEESPSAQIKEKKRRLERRKKEL